MKNKKVKVISFENNWILLGEDGYTTSKKVYFDLEKATKAAIRETNLVNNGKQSRMKWDYYSNHKNPGNGA